MRKVTFLFFLLYGFSFVSIAQSQTVLASWYGPGLEGNTMANGEAFRSKDPTIAAHNTLPLGTKVLVKNPENGRKLVVTVKDRGPYKRGRKLDLSRAGAWKLGYIEDGITMLDIRIIGYVE